MRFATYLAAGSCILSVLSVNSSPVEAQTSARDQGAVIAITSAFPWQNATSAVVRDAAQDRDIIVMREASASALEAALITLAKRRRINAAPQGIEVTTIISADLDRTPRTARLEAFLADILRRVERAPVSNVGNLGTGHWIVVADLRPQN